MKHPVIKLIIAVLLTLILFSVMLFGFITIGEVFGVHERMESASVKLDGITMNISNMLATYNKLVNSYSEQLATNAALFSVALSDEVRTLGDASIRAYDNACVVKKQGSTIVLPEDGEDIPPMVAVPYTGSAPIGVEDKPVFSGDGGLFWTRRETDPEDSFLLCTYYRLYGDYFYVSYIPDSEIVEYFNSRINVNKLMDATQEVYGGLIVGIQTTDERLPVFRVPDELQQYQYAADMGITLNNVDTDEYQAITIDGKRYEYAISDPLVVDGDAMPIRIIFLVPQASFVRKNVEGNVVLGEICMGMMMVVIIWMISARIKRISAYSLITE